MAAADDSAYQDNPYGAQDPAALFQSLTKDNESRGAMGQISQGALNTGFNPAMQHAQMVQSSLAKIMQDTPAQEGEDPLDTQLRQAKAITQGMLKVDPATAMRANQQVIRLQQAKTQQDSLQSEVGLRKAQAQEAQIKNAQARTVVTMQNNENVNGLPLRTTQSLGTLDPMSATYHTDLQDLLNKNPGAVPMSNDDYVKALAADGQNRATAMYYGTAARINASAANQGEVPYNLMPETDKDVAGYKSILGIPQPADLQRKGQMRVGEKIQSGELSMDDVAQAPTEMAALKRATLTAAQREGTISGLSASLTGLGNNVKQALAEVERVGAGATDYRLLNAALQYGDKNFMVGDNSEKAVALRRLYTAENELIYEHGRLLSGGGARTNVSAVKDARQNMSVSDNPDVIRGAVDQIVQKALPVITNANSSALVMLSNPKAYPSVAKMAKAFGGSNLWGQRDDQSLRAEQAPPSQNPTGQTTNAAPAAPTAPTGQPRGYQHLWLRNPNAPAQ